MACKAKRLTARGMVEPNLATLNSTPLYTGVLDKRWTDTRRSRITS
jgi:hypothetical protein